MLAVLLVIISASISTPQQFNMPLSNIRDQYFKYSGQHLGNTVHRIWRYPTLPQLTQLIPGAQDISRMIFVRRGPSWIYVLPPLAQNSPYRHNWVSNTLPNLRGPTYLSESYLTGMKEQTDSNSRSSIQRKISDASSDDVAQENRRNFVEDTEDTKRDRELKLKDIAVVDLVNKDEVAKIPMKASINQETTQTVVVPEVPEPKPTFNTAQVLSNKNDKVGCENVFVDIKNLCDDRTSTTKNEINTVTNLKVSTKEMATDEKIIINVPLERSSTPQQTDNLTQQVTKSTHPTKIILDEKIAFSAPPRQENHLHRNGELNDFNIPEKGGLSDISYNSQKKEEVFVSPKYTYSSYTTLHHTKETTNAKKPGKVMEVEYFELEDTETREPTTDIMKVIVTNFTTLTQRFNLTFESSTTVIQEWVTGEMENNNNETITPATYNIKYTQNGQIRQVTTNNKQRTEFVQSNNTVDYVAKIKTNVPSYLNEHVNEVNEGLTDLRSSNESIFKDFKLAVAKMEKQFYSTSFRLLSANSPDDRRKNGISFVLSTVWLHMLLLLISGEVDDKATPQLDKITHFPRTLREKDIAMKAMMASLPPPSESLKLTWSSRLVVGAGVAVSDEFCVRANATLGLVVDRINTDNVTQLVDTLNDMVRRDTGGTMRGTFEEEDVGGGVTALLLNTLYLRSRWRAPVTLLNGSRDFRDAPAGPYRQTRMFRVNDVVGYADLPEWDAEVVEIPYATANLSLLAVVPRAARGLRAAGAWAAAAGAEGLLPRLRPRRVAVSLPLFTLRMTLLLPNKLQAMGAPALVSHKGAERDGGLRLSHAVQRLMFWAEAGRNAYKDDGIEWDPAPEMSLVVDRPYFFMVKHKDVVLMTAK